MLVCVYERTQTDRQTDRQTELHTYTHITYLINMNELITVGT